MKRLWLALLLVLALLPAAALADTGIYYWDYDPDSNQLIKKELQDPCNTNVEEYLSYSSNTLDSGWYYLQGSNDSDVEYAFNDRITISGNVHLIVGNGVGLTLSNGIYLPKGSSLTLYAEAADGRTCHLQAYDYGGNAAIGGNAGSGMDCGNLTINGVNVIANGANDSSSVSVGIGGGYNASGAGGNGGTITINGGAVFAFGGKHAAGIGGGSSANGQGGNGGSLTVNGGEVHAYGGDRAAGIGGGYSETGAGGNGATVTVKGGKVNVYGGEYAAVFGGGCNAAGHPGTGGSLTVEGGEVRAYIKNNGVGFGNGSTVTIKGGSVNVTRPNSFDSITGKAFADNAVLNFQPKQAAGSEKVNAIRVRRSSSSTDVLRLYSGNTDVLANSNADKELFTATGTMSQNDSEGVFTFYFDTVEYWPLSVAVPKEQTCVLGETPELTINITTATTVTPPDASSFTVLYRPEGGSDWSESPSGLGVYDVRIQRPMDDFESVDEVFTGVLTVLKNSQNAPTGVAAVAETIRHRNDGKITGVTDKMEYRAEAASGYTAVTGTEVAGLAPGTYFVRFKETDTCFASPEATVTVASGPAAYDTDSTQKARGITADNVQPEDEALLKQALSDYQSALDTYGDRFTEKEKQEIQAEMGRIEAALEALRRAAAVRETIAALPDAVEPDDTETEARILAAKADLDALTAHEKALVGDALTAKLDSLTAMLTAYSFTSGDGASITEGQNTALSFTANGPLSKMVAVLVDGQTLDAKHYTAQSGSTIITLAADYVKTLATGEHTLTVRYKDGETSAHFTVAAMPADLPQTGDSSNVAIWLALAAACACALGIILWKRKH